MFVPLSGKLPGGPLISHLFVNSIILAHLASADWRVVQDEMYKTIDKYLTEHVKSEEVSENLKAALDWHNEQVSNSWHDALIVGALENFAKLGTVFNSEQCDKSAWDLIVSNDEATEGRALGLSAPPRWKSNDGGELRRIDKIIRQVARERVQACHNKYPSEYEKFSRLKRREKDKLYFVYVSDAIASKAQDETIVNNEFEIRPNAAIEEFIRGPDNKHSALKAITGYLSQRRLLRILMQKPTNGVLSETAAARVEAVGKLFESCEQHVKQTGPNIFEPAQVATQVATSAKLGGGLVSRYDATRNRQLYLGYLRYQICQTLISEVSQEKLSKELIEM